MVPSGVSDSLNEHGWKGTVRDKKRCADKLMRTSSAGYGVENFGQRRDMKLGGDKFLPRARSASITMDAVNQILWKLTGKCISPSLKKIMNGVKEGSYVSISYMCIF